MINRRGFENTTTHLKKNCSRFILVYYFSTLPTNGIVTLRCFKNCYNVIFYFVFVAMGVHARVTSKYCVCCAIFKIIFSFTCFCDIF